MPKYILGLHYLTILGVLIIAVGTFLVQRGNSLKGKEENKKLSTRTEELRFPVPDIIYADLTVDIKIGDNVYLKQFKDKIESLKGGLYYHEGTIFLNSLEKSLTSSKEKISFKEDIDFVLDQFRKVKLGLRFYSGEKKYLLSENTETYENFNGGVSEMNDEGQRNQIGTLIYLTKEGHFSIFYKNFPLVIKDRFPQFNSLYDFKETSVNIDFNADYWEQIEFRPNEFASKLKENQISEVEINRVVIKTNNLVFANIEDLEMIDIQQFKGKIKELIDWK